MPLNAKQRTARLVERTDELSAWSVRAHVALTDWRFDGEAIAPGAAWPRRDGIVALAHGSVRVPDDWPLEQTLLALDLGGEGLVRIRTEDGQDDAFGHDPHHRRYPLRSRTFSVAAECVARSLFGVPARDAALREARIVLVDEPVEQLVRLLTLIAETAEQLAGDDVVDPLLAAAERACHAIVLPTATGPYVSRISGSARMQRIWQLPGGLDDDPPGLTPAQSQAIAAIVDGLRADLAALKERHPQTGALALTGHAHIDLAWLWPMDETRRKARRTFSSMTDLVDRYPDFLFNQSTAQIYAFLEEDDPVLLERIKGQAAAGRWETLGGTWVEMDTNMPCGESFARQILYGQRYFERHFGTRHRVHWLPDCFGFSPALPQLLRQGGMDSFFTIKVTWSETNPMPHDVFWWEGLDGSRVLTHTYNNPDGGYNAHVRPASLVPTWRNYRGKHAHPESLMCIGIGDGGGGTSIEMLENQKALADFPALPSLRPVRAHDFFADLHETAGETALPVWVGEMYLEYHRGTLTSQARTKYLHRHAERALVTAEVLGAMATLAGQPRAGSLEPHWHVLLRNQFHDILPGSSIHEVHVVAERELGAVIEAGRTEMDAQFERLVSATVEAGPLEAVLAVNPDLSPRPYRVHCDGAIAGGQQVADGWVACSGEAIDPLSAAVVVDAAPPAGLSVSSDHLENAFVRVEIGADGTLTRVFDKKAQRDVLDGRGNQIWVYRDRPRVYDAWELEDDTELQGDELIASSSAEVVEQGPHRAAVRITRSIGDSTITQTLRLWANGPRLDIATDIDWHDRKLLVKALFPLAVRTDRVLYECAFGVHARPTHRNTSWDAAKFEVAGHRFAVMAEHGYGVALINDGKYGHHAHGNVLGLSLLRSAVYPDPMADEGRHSFTYALYPHSGDWLSGGVLAEAEDVNQPLLARPVKAASATTWQAVSVNGLRLGLGGIKPAEDGAGLIMRTYEPAGARGAVGIGLPEGWRVDRTVNLLEDDLGAPDFGFTPFQVRSWLLKPDGA